MFDYRSVFCSAIIVLAYFVNTAQSLGEESVTWKAGAAAVPITPDQPMWMGGYASRTKPSQGKVHDLFAKALVLEDGQSHRFVIVTTDLLGITPELRSFVSDEIEKRYGLPDHALLMNASHTHCGPEIREGLVLQRNGDAAFAAKARQYTRQLSAKIVGLIGQAIDKLQPANLTYSYARAGFAMNRRRPTPDGYKNSPYPDGPVDHPVRPHRHVGIQDDRDVHTDIAAGLVNLQTVSRRRVDRGAIGRQLRWTLDHFDAVRLGQGGGLGGVGAQDRTVQHATAMDVLEGVGDDRLTLERQQTLARQSLAALATKNDSQSEQRRPRRWSAYAATAASR